MNASIRFTFQYGSTLMPDRKGNRLCKLSLIHIEMCIRDREYTDGVSQVNDGARQLDDGVSTLTAKVPELTSGIDAPVSYTHLVNDNYSYFLEIRSIDKTGSEDEEIRGF